MSYVWITWLADALRDEGCVVREESGWKSRGRPASTGGFNPYAAGMHHTGTTSSSSNPCPTLNMCINGRSDLPGPLCHVVVGYDGVCHVIAAGRANHAGNSDGDGPLSTGDGNWQMVGFEIDYNGTQSMSSKQYDAAIRGAAAVLRHYKKDSSYCRGHKEWSTTGKWDPGGYSMPDMRADVGKQLKGTPEPEKDDEMNDFIQASSGDPITVKDGEWKKINWQNVQAGADFLPEGWAQIKIGKKRFIATLTAEVAPTDPSIDSIRTRFVELEDNNGDWDPGTVTETYMTTEHKNTGGNTYLTDTRVQFVPEGRRLQAEVNISGGGRVEQARLTVLCFQP